jgi:FixJ family two-component response regulator
MNQQLAWPRRSGAPPQPDMPLLWPPSCAPVRTASASDAGFPVYLVEAERGLRIALIRDLNGAGFEARPFADVHDLAAALPELAPGCVILEIAAVLSVARALREDEGTGALRYPTILTFSSLQPEQAVAAVRLGAADLLQAPVSPGELVAAIRRAAPKVRAMELRLAAARAGAAIDTLTPRERQVMEFVMVGLANKAIARALGISPRTVEMHRAHLHRRLGVGSLAELLALAWHARSAGG